MNSFDVLAVLKKYFKRFTKCCLFLKKKFYNFRLKRLHLNNNNICSIPYLKIVGKDHVIQEFPKSYYKNKQDTRKKSSNSENRNSLHNENANANAKLAVDLDMHKTNPLRNSFILEEDEEVENGEEQQNKDTLKRISSEIDNEKPISLPFSELTFIDLSYNQVNYL